MESPVLRLPLRGAFDTWIFSDSSGLGGPPLAPHKYSSRRK